MPCPFGASARRTDVISGSWVGRKMRLPSGVILERGSIAGAKGSDLNVKLGIPVDTEPIPQENVEVLEDVLGRRQGIADEKKCDEMRATHLLVGT